MPFLIYHLARSFTLQCKFAQQPNTMTNIQQNSAETNYNTKCYKQFNFDHYLKKLLFTLLAYKINANTMSMEHITIIP